MVNVKATRKVAFCFLAIEYLNSEGEKPEKKFFLSPMDYPKRNSRMREGLSPSFGYGHQDGHHCSDFIAVGWNSEREWERKHNAPRIVCSCVTFRPDSSRKYQISDQKGFLWERIYNSVL